MNYKKQDFNEQELALFFQAFGKNLFTRPKKGDVISVLIDDSGNCSLYFISDYYEVLKNDIISAYEQGKFAKSNAQVEWENLMNIFLSAKTDQISDSLSVEDYFLQVGSFWR